ncbi:MAG: Zn-dependent hydrolase, glyoxylase [Clostridiaceae bacterium]|jgi:glyoxylase-like metal-dependent hydrolase (beta-lactamase superfamily II)|nr:Zn-dependent hydrolase, glyoxylase [Clostridiaceae bacterium]
MKILNLTYKSTNCYLLQCNEGWIMIDAGWPETFPQLMHLLKQQNVNTGDIKYLLVTHFHPDHAGLAQNFKDLGVKLIVHETQTAFVDKLNNFFKNKTKADYKDITHENNIVVSSDESKRLLKKLGIEGEIIKTPGHSDDSVSLIIDKCCAFTGDLPKFSLMEAYNDEIIKESWRLIQSYNAEKIYPAHGNQYTL